MLRNFWVESPLKCLKRRLVYCNLDVDILVLGCQLTSKVSVFECQDDTILGGISYH